VAYRERARQREAERKWYLENRQRVVDKKTRKKARLRALVRAAKSRPCSDCGVEYPYYVMDFDHVTGDKVMIISDLVQRGATTKLLRELEKCEVVCANCHRVRTWQRRKETASSVSLSPASPSVRDAQLKLF
jgi:hypothetical protein